MIARIPAEVYLETSNTEDRFSTRYQTTVRWRRDGIEHSLHVGPTTFGGEAAIYRAHLEELLLHVYEAGKAAGAEQAVDDLLRK